MAENSRLQFIDNELKKFNVTDSAIAELSDKYTPLVVNGIDDKDGLKAVTAARKIVKGYRIDVDKRRKELNADALEYQRRINGEAKRIIALLEPIEDHLIEEEKKVNDEIERIKLEKEQQEALILHKRIEKLLSIGFKYDGIKYFTEYLDTFSNEIIISHVLHLKQMTNEMFDSFFENAKHYFDIEEKSIAERKARDEEERKALTEERARLDAIAKEQSEKDSALKAEAERLAYLKSKEEVMKPCPPSSEAPVHVTFKQPEDQSPVILNINNHGEKRIGGVYTEKPITVLIEDINKSKERRKDIMFLEGFDAAIDLVINHVDKSDLFQSGEGKEIADSFKDELSEEVEIYKKDG